MPVDPLAGYNLTPEEQQRMMLHLAGGGYLGEWQLGDQVPSAERMAAMSDEERRALGLTDPEFVNEARYNFRQRIAGQPEQSMFSGAALTPQSMSAHAPWVRQMSNFGAPVVGMGGGSNLQQHSYGTLGSLT